MQKVIILRGVPSSGKSTIAKSYRNYEEKIAWLKVDNFKDFFAEDASAALSFVNGAAVATFEYLLSEGLSVVIDGVFQDTKAIDKAIEIAKKHNVPCKVFELEVSLETLIKRDTIREGVPEGLRKPLGEETITKIYEVYKNNPYSSAIKLNTENNHLEECKKIIKAYFK
jgi:predicted kinase